jgi:hypothetical protein
VHVVVVWDIHHNLAEVCLEVGNQPEYRHCVGRQQDTPVQLAVQQEGLLVHMGKRSVEQGLRREPEAGM